MTERIKDSSPGPEGTPGLWAYFTAAACPAVAAAQAAHVALLPPMKALAETVRFELTDGVNRRQFSRLLP